MALIGDVVRRLFRSDGHDDARRVERESGPTYEELYEMERWSLAALSGFQDIVTGMIDRGVEESRGY